MAGWNPQMPKVRAASWCEAWMKNDYPESAEKKRIRVEFIWGNYARLAVELMRQSPDGKTSNDDEWCFLYYLLFCRQCSVPIIAVCHGLVDSEVGCRDTSVCIAPCVIQVHICIFNLVRDVVFENWILHILIVRRLCLSNWLDPFPKSQLNWMPTMRTRFTIFSFAETFRRSKFTNKMKLFYAILNLALGAVDCAFSGRTNQFRIYDKCGRRSLCGQVSSDVIFHTRFAFNLLCTPLRCSSSRSFIIVFSLPFFFFHSFLSLAVCFRCIFRSN